MPLSPSAPPTEAKEEPYAHSPKESHQVAADRIFAHQLLAEETEEDGEHRGDCSVGSVSRRTAAAVGNVELEEGIAGVPSEVTWFLETAAAGGIDLRRSYKKRLFFKPSAVTLWLDWSSPGNAYFWCSADLRDAGFFYQKSCTSFFFRDIVSAVPVVNFFLSRRRTNSFIGLGLRYKLNLLSSGLL